MARLMEQGLRQLTDLVMEMARVSERSVRTAVEAYATGRAVDGEIFGWAEELRLRKEEVGELATELLARYQPVASDLRFIRSAMEISYGFARLGRYAYDIAMVLQMFGDLSRCDRSIVREVGNCATSMIRQSIEAFAGRDAPKAATLPQLDDLVDSMYLSFVRSTLVAPQGDLRCSLATVLVLRYLERIADHATSIGDATVYIVTGESPSRPHHRRDLPPVQSKG